MYLPRTKIRGNRQKSVSLSLFFKRKKRYVHSYRTHAGGDAGGICGTKMASGRGPAGRQRADMGASVPAGRGSGRQRDHHPQPACPGNGGCRAGSGRHAGQRHGGSAAVEGAGTRAERPDGGGDRPCRSGEPAAGHAGKPGHRGVLRAGCGQQPRGTGAGTRGDAGASTRCAD